MSEKKDKQLKILIIRFSSIGDIVLTTPVIRCIKTQIHAKIHFLTKKSYYDVVKANSYIDEIITLENDSEIPTLIDILKKERYDYIIDLHRNIRTLKIKSMLGVKSFTFPKLNISKWLLVNLKINLMPNIHIVDRYFKAVSKLGVVNDYKGLDYFIPHNDKILTTDIHKDLQPGKYFALVIGAQHETKKMPIHKWKELIRSLPMHAVILGDSGDKIQASKIIEGEKTPFSVVDATGKININQSAWLVKNAAGVVTHDTGLMHIAAAFHRPIISIWGNTVPALGMFPYYPKGNNLNTTLEVKGLSCRPCSKIGHNSCPRGHFECMEKQSIPNALNVLNNLHLGLPLGMDNEDRDIDVNFL
jgi:ADP-heptose:LPS heptosyltransferase